MAADEGGELGGVAVVGAKVGDRVDGFGLPAAAAGLPRLSFSFNL
jgi:hypothetical protein